MKNPKIPKTPQNQDNFRYTDLLGDFLALPEEDQLHYYAMILEDLEKVGEMRQKAEKALRRTYGAEKFEELAYLATTGKSDKSIDPKSKQFTDWFSLGFAYGIVNRLAFEQTILSKDGEFEKEHNMSMRSHALKTMKDAFDKRESKVGKA